MSGGSENSQDPLSLVVFLLDDQRYALRLPVVERVVRVVDITPLPAAPEIVLGVVDVQGRIVPVVDPRRRFRLPPRPITLSDQLVVARTARRTVALVVDGVADVVNCDPAACVIPEHIVGGADYLEAVARLDDGLLLIHDLDRFLSLDEEASLDQALRA